MSERRDERYYRAWMSHRHVSRRGLLRGLLGAGARCNARRCRPPTACARAPALCLGGGGLLASCDGCAACVTACPYGLIALHEGVAWLEVDFCGCDTQHCQACADACSRGHCWRSYPLIPPGARSWTAIVSGAIATVASASSPVLNRRCRLMHRVSRSWMRRAAMAVGCASWLAIPAIYTSRPVSLMGAIEALSRDLARVRVTRLQHF